MAFYSGYDTDDLTQRQYHYFCKLTNNRKEIGVYAINFLKNCVAQNYSLSKFDNYEGDCNYLIRHPEMAKKAGIVLSEIYN